MGIGGAYLFGINSRFEQILTSSQPWWVMATSLTILCAVLVVLSYRTRLDSLALCTVSLIIGLTYATLSPTTIKHATAPTESQEFLHFHISSLVEPSTTRSFVESITTGNRSDMEQSTRQIFQHAGISHLLAISGYHISLLCIIIFFVTRKLRTTIRRKQVINLITVLLLWGYAAVLGFQPSITRAILMFTILQLAKILDRNSDTLYLCSLTATIMLIADPSLISSISFQLSFSAILGITLLFFPLSERIDKWKERRQAFQKPDIHPVETNLTTRTIIYFAKALLISLSCTLFTLPLTSYHFGSFSLVGPFTNLIANIFTPILLLLSITWWFLSFISTQMASVLWSCIDWLFTVFYKCMKWCADTNFSTFYLSTDKMQVLLLFVILFCFSELTRNFNSRNLTLFMCSCTSLLLYILVMEITALF